MPKFINNVHVEGYVFSHSLTRRVTGPNSKSPNTPYISGQIDVVTDDEGLNVVSVHFSYVTETYGKSGKLNDTYQALGLIIDHGLTWKSMGKNSTKVRIDGQIELNDWYNRDGELVSAKRVSGSFLHILNSADDFSDRRNRFKVDMLIVGISPQEDDDMEYINLKGYCFNFKNDFLPITLSVRDENGIKFFESQDPSTTNPLLTTVWGKIIATTVRNEESVESAFGEDDTKVSTRTFRAWEVTGTPKIPKDFGDESVMTEEDFKKGLEQRQMYLATLHQRYEDSQSNVTKSDFPRHNSVVAPSPTEEDDFPF